MSQPHQQHEQLQRRRRRCRQPAEPCECLRPVIRVFGLLTSFGKHKCKHTPTPSHTYAHNHKSEVIQVEEYELNLTYTGST